MITSLIFREITAIEELRIAFRLRYQVYNESKNKSFIRLNEQGIDIDSFDLNAKHYAIFRAQELVGYIRVIFPKKRYKNPLADSIIKEFDILMPQAPKEDYPFLSYENVPESHFEFKKTLEDNGDVICEASRFVVHPLYQSTGVAKLMMECSYAPLILHKDCSYAVVNCCPTHERFYSRYGMKNIDGNKRYTTNGVEKITLSIMTTPWAITEPYREHLLALNEQYRRNQQIILTL
jgi:predicted GNAT family N-acyltransferase